MKLIYKIIRIAHLPDGQVIEKIVDRIDNTELEDIQQEANTRYLEELEKMQSFYFPTSPFTYNPSKGIGYAVNLEAVREPCLGDLGGELTYILKTTYHSSKSFNQAAVKKEEELLQELSRPSKYPVNRLWINGNSDIGYMYWEDHLLYFYEVKLIKIFYPDNIKSETLYRVGHRHLGEARKIALSLFHEEAEKLELSDDHEEFDPRKGPSLILSLQLFREWEKLFTVESNPPLPILSENQREEMRIFHQNHLVYNKTDATPSAVNQIEDLWAADHLTVYDYKVMSPHKKYDLIRYIYNLWSIERGGGEDSIDHIEEFAHHDLTTAQEVALSALREKVQGLQDKYSPDILDNADATITSYNYYLELKEVGKDFRIIIEASFSYDGTDITQKDEEKRIFEDLKREDPSSTFVNNRQKKNGHKEEKSNKKKDTNHPKMRNLIEDEKSQEGQVDEEDNGLSF